MANNTIYPYGTNGELPSSIGLINDLTTGGVDKALTAEMGKEIGEELYGVRTLCDLSSLSIELWYIDGSNLWIPVTTGKTRAVFLPVTAGEKYEIVNDSGYNSFYFALLTVSSGGPDNTTPSFATGYSGRIQVLNGNKLVVTAPSDAVSMWVRTKDGNNNNVTPNIYHLLEGGLLDDIDSIQEDIGVLQSNIEEVSEKIEKNEVESELIIGSLVNQKNDSSGLPGDASTTRVGSATTIAVPYKGVTITFKLPNMYVGEIRCGEKAQNLDSNNYWYRDGDTFTFPSLANFYRVIFAIQPTPNVSEYNTIVASDVEDMIESGDIKITYTPVDDVALHRNAPSDCYVRATIQKLTATSANNGLDKFPIMIHTSDIHGDAYRLQDAIDMAKVNNADFILVTGDVNANVVNNGFGVFEDIMENSPIPVLYCRGNHESYGNSDTSFDVFGTYYSKLATKWGYLKSANTTTDKTWYYKDFASKSIRVISLNPYESNLTTNKAYAMSQDQVDFFIATLKSTPQGYGIIVIMHSPEAYPNNTMPVEAIEGKEDFYPYRNITIDAPAGIAGTPLKDIVDAFISRTTISESFTQTITGGTTETITISGDFTSGIATGVEFIAWMTGHTHSDIVGVYKNTTNRQVMLNVTCGICYYGPSTYPYLCNGSDLPRGSFGVPQDAFNVYAIDRTNKQIRIARIGSNCTHELSKREAMIIDYSD